MGHVPGIACVPELVRDLKTAPTRCGPTKLVCIDGPAGSGKTTLAGALGEALGGAPVVHMDDLYRGWTQELGAELAARVDDWLLSPWQAGSMGRYRSFDWANDRFADEWTIVPPAPVALLEGCASASRGIRGRASLVVWVEAPPALRSRRALMRDGEWMSEQWRAWQSHEAEHFAADATRQAADVVLDGSTGRIIARGGSASP